MKVVERCGRMSVVSCAHRAPSSRAQLSPVHVVAAEGYGCERDLPHVVFVLVQANELTGERMAEKHDVPFESDLAGVIYRSDFVVPGVGDLWEAARGTSW